MASPAGHEPAREIALGFQPLLIATQNNPNDNPMAYVRVQNHHFTKRERKFLTVLG